ncbi:hypothetical protein [Paenibacillus sp. 32O-W]|nr:hypothetical protein [Paenibacillus sp. 32O-W]
MVSAGKTIQDYRAKVDRKLTEACREVMPPPSRPAGLLTSADKHGG